MGRRADLMTKVFSRVTFERHADVNPDLGPCWIWTGPNSGNNGRGHSYPRMTVDGATMAVHRVVFALWFGPIPPNKQIDHKCKRRNCVAPKHLEMVTHRENQRRRDRK